jgi:hypothetical protein
MTGQFYLGGLLRCCAEVMWSVNRGQDRRYRCGVCGRGIDALSAEVEVWELAHHQYPALGGGHTPYDDRGVLLARVLHHVDLVREGVDFRFVLEVRGSAGRPGRPG